MWLSSPVGGILRGDAPVRPLAVVVGVVAELPGGLVEEFDPGDPLLELPRTWSAGRRVRLHFPWQHGTWSRFLVRDDVRLVHKPRR